MKDDRRKRHWSWRGFSLNALWFLLVSLLYVETCPIKGTNLPILLCTSEAAFNCPFPQTLGATRWKKNPKGENPFEWAWKESASLGIKQICVRPTETKWEIPCHKKMFLFLWFSPQFVIHVENVVLHPTNPRIRCQFVFLSWSMPSTATPDERTPLFPFFPLLPLSFFPLRWCQIGCFNWR